MNPKIWGYVLLYVDDALCISENAKRVLRDEVEKYFELKEASLGPPEIYLGGCMHKVTMENGAQAWACGSPQYVQARVKKIISNLLTGLCHTVAAVKHLYRLGGCWKKK